MALSPEVWEGIEESWGPFPKIGDRIRCYLRCGDIITGTVSLIWDAMGEPVISVMYYGTRLHVFPSLGDRWEAVEQ